MDEDLRIGGPYLYSNPLEFISLSHAISVYGDRTPSNSNAQTLEMWLEVCPRTIQRVHRHLPTIQALATEKRTRNVPKDNSWDADTFLQDPWRYKVEMADPRAFKPLFNGRACLQWDKYANHRVCIPFPADIELWSDIIHWCWRVSMLWCYPQGRSTHNNLNPRFLW